jgi:hypothetical protein
MPLLNGVLQLHDVQNVENFCRRAIQAEMRRLRMPGLNPTDHDEALAYVIAECWILSERYNPALTPSFSTYAYPKCRLRFINWLHTKLGRNPNRKPPHYLEDLRADQLVTARNDDPPGDRDADLVRLLRTGSRANADTIDELGESPTPRAA